MASTVAHPPERAYDARGRRRTRRPSASRRRTETILGRRDVAVVPWIVISIGGFVLALSTWLRGPAGHVDSHVLLGGLIVGVLTAGMASIQDTRIGRRYRGALPVYLVGSAGLMIFLAVLAIHEQGVATPFYAVNVLLASYLGLVLPGRWAALSIVLLIATGALVDIIQPTHGLDQVIPTMLCVAAWFTGLLCHVAHDRAARFAGALSRYDQLTNMLNRRGFLDRVARALRRGPNLTDGPIALLIIDLDGFKQVNDTQGHAAGDAILSWVGEAIPDVLPPRAELGRLGGDEFAVLLPGASSGDAHAVGTKIRELLAARIGSSIGIATSETRAVASTDLFRVADAAMYLCKQDRTRGVQTLVAGSSGLAVERRSTRRKAPAATLSYANLRASGAPRVPKTGSIYGRLVCGGFLTIAAAGTSVVVSVFLGSDHHFFDMVLRYLGVPWILANVGLGIFSFNRELSGRTYWWVIIVAAVLLGGGVGAAMLTDGGLTAPIGSALFLQTLFMASVVPKRHAAITTSILFFFWCIVAILSPASTLWVIPFQLSMFGSSFALGAIGYAAFVDVTDHALSLARTDALTLIRNRLGFEEQAGDALAVARATDTPFALLALDLDDFKGINDTQGHEAGDRILRRVAEILTDAFPDGHTIARLGGDEFVVIVPVAGAEESARRATDLADTLHTVVDASVGHATFPGDGNDLDALMIAADHRSYEVKRARKAARADLAGTRAA